MPTQINTPPRYKNLPGTFLELLDGNLQIDRAITGPVTLVIGTAYSGPSNAQYLVRDSNAASMIFGSESPVIKAISQARLGGSENVVIYRVGGQYAIIEEIFGQDSYIRTIEETTFAGGKYSLYIGPEPSNPALACIIAFEGDKIVYSNVTGSEVDHGKIEVFGFDKATYSEVVGSPSAPVQFQDVLVTLGATPAPVVTPGTETIATADLLLSNPLSVGGASVTSVYLDTLELTLEPGLVPAQGQYSIDPAGSGTNPSQYDLVILDTADANSGDDLVVSYTTVVTGGPAVDITGFTYTPGADNVNSSLQKKYELLDQAYQDLETTIATHTTIAIEGCVLDAPNVADGSVAADRLSYLHKEEHLGECTYTWSNHKVEYDAGGNAVTTDPLLAVTDANGQPVVVRRYSEVNFAHQLGSWCHRITENERFMLATIGTSLPAAPMTSVVAKWIGTLPQTDINGRIIVNGTGLLGNKYMTGGVNFDRGFFLTDSGFPDGNIQTDSNGAPIDLGKFMSIVSGCLVTPSLSSLGSKIGIANGGVIYCGLLTTVNAGESTTNRSVPQVGLPFTTKKTKLDELSGAGYVTFTTKPSGEVSVTSGELPTGPRSDYDYISTTIIIAEIVREIRARLNPFLGKGLNSAMIAAMETAVEAILQANADAGAITNYLFSIVPEPVVGGRGKVRVPLTIVPAFELREINVPIKLAYDI